MTRPNLSGIPRDRRSARRSLAASAAVEKLELRVLLSAYSWKELGRTGNDITFPQDSGPVLVDSAGDLFAVAYGGGADDLGAVYEIAAGSSAVTALASFDGTNGQWPSGELAINSNGDLFGATQREASTRKGPSLSWRTGVPRSRRWPPLDRTAAIPGAAS